MDVSPSLRAGRKLAPTSGHLVVNHPAKSTPPHRTQKIQRPFHNRTQFKTSTHRGHLHRQPIGSSQSFFYAWHIESVNGILLGQSTRTSRKEPFPTSYGHFVCLFVSRRSFASSLIACVLLQGTSILTWRFLINLIVSPERVLSIRVLFKVPHTGLCTWVTIDILLICVELKWKSLNIRNDYDSWGKVGGGEDMILFVLSAIAQCPA